MLDQWEQFEAGPNERSDEKLYVSINGKGQILLNKKAVDCLEAPATVVLFFSKPSQKIGIRAARSIDKGAFPLKTRPLSHSRMVHASPFCRNYGIRVNGTVSFVGIKLDNDGLLVLDLNKTTRVSRVTAR
jgi:hypothetical protein